MARGRADLQATETTDDSSLPHSQLHRSVWPCCSGRVKHGPMAAVNLWVLSHPSPLSAAPRTQKCGVCLFVFSSYHLWLYGFICLMFVSVPGPLRIRIEFLFSFTLSFLEIMTHKPFVYFSLGTCVICVCVCFS